MKTRDFDFGYGQDDCLMLCLFSASKLRPENIFILRQMRKTQKSIKILLVAKSRNLLELVIWVGCHLSSSSGQQIRVQILNSKNSWSKQFVFRFKKRFDAMFFWRQTKIFILTQTRKNIFLCTVKHFKKYCRTKYFLKCLVWYPVQGK